MKRRVADDLVRDVDLAPTIMDYARAQQPKSQLTVELGPRDGDFDGRSLRPLLDGGTSAPRPVFAETEIWMTESIPELPSYGAAPLRIPYPNVAQLTELDPRLGYDIVTRAEIEPLLVAAKHRMVIDGNWKLIYVPTRKGARYFLYDRVRDPGETVNVMDQHPQEAARLRSILWKWMLDDPQMEERSGMLLPRSAPTGAGAPADGASPLGLRVP